MHFISLFATIFILLATTARSAFLFRRDEDDGPVIVKATVTEVDVETNLHVVNAPTTTVTEVNWITSTQTFTRYTATVTSIIKGVPVTITSPVLGTTEVVSQVEASAAPSTENTESPLEPAVATTNSAVIPTSTQAFAQASSSSQNIISSTMPLVSPSPTTPFSESMIPTSSSIEAIMSATTTTAPDAASSSTNWSTYNLSTETSQGVCFVNYDYIDLDEPISTVTQVATTTLYVTRQ